MTCYGFLEQLLPVMPSSSLPIGGNLYSYMGFNNPMLHRQPPGPPPGSPAAQSNRLNVDTDLIMVSLTVW